MATMFPSTLPDYVRKDPYREAEVDVYEQLKSQLPDSYRCYYSRPWLGLTASGEEREGEADFVVAHPDRGFLVIEVKGGAVSRLQGSEQWVSRNRHGITNYIKDPIKQASDSRHALLKKLKGMPGWDHHYVTARHGAILPGCTRPGKDLGPSMPLFLFAFSKDMENLEEWVTARLGRHDDGDGAGNGLGRDGMQALHSLLSGPVELRANLQRSLKADRREIERLTRDQLDVLDSLEEQPQMAISGGAGTGKTLLALEKASRLAEAGQRVLLTCFNQALGENLRTLSAGYPNIIAGGFHALCLDIIKTAGEQPPASASKRDLFDDALPSALVDAVAAHPALAFDAVIIDEGQDFRDGWLTALRLCLKEPETGSFYIFYDDNQKVYNRSSGWIADLPPSKYHLTRNMRNTKAIHDCSKPWYSSPRSTRASGPDGEPVEWIPATSPQSLKNAVRATLSDLVGRHGLARGDIAVLTAGTVENNPLVVHGKLADVAFVSARENSADHIVFDTVRRYKGLDRPVILLVDTEHLTDPELTYVALTRPSLLLYVFGTPASIGQLQASVGIS